MKVIAYMRPDGGLSIDVPAIGFNEDLTEDEALARAMKVVPADAVDVTIVDTADIPNDRTYRNAWVSVGGAVVHDMPKARDIHRQHLRALRAPLLAALDIEMTRALRNPALQDEIEAKRQALRDVTADPAIEAANTPEELKAVQPSVLASGPNKVSLLRN